MNTTTIDIIKNITNPQDLIFNINDASGGILGVTILFVIYMVLFIGLLNHTGDLKTSYNASTYTTMFLAWILWILDMLADTWLQIFLILTIIGVISLFIRRDS